jgi:tetratricopeptide (TPR) repeat protein
MSKNERHRPTIKGRPATHTDVSAWKRHFGWSASVVAATLYVGTMLVAVPFRRIFEFDTDEGINAIKALLVDRGYMLYSQIWDDQPPLLTYLLRFWCHVVGWETYNGRILVLLFAGLLVFAVYDALRSTYGHPAAIAAVLLLPCTAYFTRLSVSIMVGLPAITFATLCLWALVRWTNTHRVGWLVAAGVLMGLSLATKLFTLFLVPIFGMWVAWMAVRDPRLVARWRVVLAPGLWGCVVLLTAAAVLVSVVPSDGWGQLYHSHLSARAAAHPGGAVAALHEGLWRDWEVMILAGLGVALMVVRRRRVLAIAPAWCVAAYGALLMHAPVWYHHHLLLSIPACMTAGVAVGELFTARSPSKSSVESAILTAVHIVTVGVTVVLFVALVSGAKHEPLWLADLSDHDRFVLELIKAYPKRSDVMVADRPMFAFEAGYEVPLNLAVMSRKRAATENLTAQEFIETIDRTNPEHVIFSSKLGEFAAPFADVMQGRYRLVYTDPDSYGLQVFVRGDIAGDPLPMLLQAAERVPNVAAAHDAIGIAWAQRGDPERAVASFRRARALDPRAPRPLLHLAEAHLARGEYATGFAMMQDGMQTKDLSSYTAIARVYAWRRATCPDAAYRDGAEAVVIARAVSQQAQPPLLADQETIAAGLAAQGKFAAARAVAEGAMREAEATRREAARNRITHELELYQRNELVTAAVRMPTS